LGSIHSSSTDVECLGPRPLHLSVCYRLDSQLSCSTNKTRRSCLEGKEWLIYSEDQVNRLRCRSWLIAATQLTLKTARETLSWISLDLFACLFNHAIWCSSTEGTQAGLCVLYGWHINWHRFTSRYSPARFEDNGCTISLLHSMLAGSHPRR
jgi:hypothetical protein